MTPSSGARWSRPAPALVLALALALAAQHCSTVRAAPAWIPDMTMKFEYQLSKVFDVAKDFDPNVQVYLLDCSDTPADAVAAIRAQGAHPIGYFSAGTYEAWRDDAAALAPYKGARLPEWAGEWWVDIRQEGVRAVMRQRMQDCKAKGFVGLDPDNADGYTNTNGLGLTAADQLAYNKWLAATAHDLGLAIGLKNAIDLIPDLVSDYDFFVNEQCVVFNECGAYLPAKLAYKPVWTIEYVRAAFKTACANQATYGIRTLLKTKALDSHKEECAAGEEPQPPPVNGTSGGGGGGSGTGGGSGGGGDGRVIASIWQPKASDNLAFQYQIGQAFDPGKHMLSGVQVYFVDCMDTSAEAVAAIASAGSYAVGYLSAGTLETWRPDAGDFTAADRGAASGAGEFWLDIRSENVKAVSRKRLEVCKSKGFVGVDLSNLDAYDANNGLGLTAADQLAYNKWLANTTHDLGLAAGLKADLGQIADLATSFDFFTSVGCQQAKACDQYQVAVALGKPVWNLETRLGDFLKACKCETAYGVKTVRKRSKLDAYRKACSPGASNPAKCRPSWRG